MDPSSLIHQAKHEFGMADHIATVTLPIAQDKHVFLNIFSHLNKSILLAIRSYIRMQNLTKKLRIVPSSDELATNIFFQKYTNPLKITVSERYILKELKDLVAAYQKSQGEIRRGEDYILFLPDFHTVRVSPNNVKRYLSVVRSLINRIESEVAKWNNWK